MRIIAAYVNDDVTIDTVQDEAETPVESVDDILETPTEVVPDIDKIKSSIKDILKVTLSGVQNRMRSYDEIVDSVFEVLSKTSIQSLDSVGLFISKAFNDR